MTNEPRGLIVDDQPDNIRHVQRILDFGFSKLNGDWRVRWSRAEDPIEAINLVRCEEFDFALIDFQLKGGETGLSIVEELRRRRNKDCYILVLTAESDSNADFLNLSKSAGADHAIIRTNHLTVHPRAKGDEDGWDAYSLARKIRKRMQVFDHADGFEIVFAEEAGVQSMLCSLGEPPGEHRNARTRGELIARTLIIDCLEREDDRDTTFTVHHLAPGRSGAHVCKVVRVASDGVAESFVLKIGMGRAALEAERAANAEAARVLSAQVLVRLDRPLRTDDSSGYTAVAAGLVNDTLTLGEWMRQPETTPEQAIALADELHGHHLIRLLQSDLRRAASTRDWLTMSPILRLRVRECLTRYSEIWKDERGAQQPDAKRMGETLLAFVNDGALPDTDRKWLGDRVTHARGFGDLHSGNILVQSYVTARPLLVDASQYGVHHWATDVTRLLVDLVLHVRRPGVESMLWSGVAADTQYASGLCHCAGDLSAAGADPVDAYIARVVERRGQYLCLAELEPREANWHWQWHVALSREFLRLGSRPGLVPTRAVVAMTAAAHHLNRAAAALRDPGTGGSAG
jgi:CheY-like chemotaxis protein